MINLYKIPNDKLPHFIVGTLVFAVFHFFNPLTGIVAATVAAVGKEIYDYFHKDKHTLDPWGAIATILGGVIGFICSM
jgi:glycerol uptake facilitator-like aquaporin